MHAILYYIYIYKCKTDDADDDDDDDFDPNCQKASQTHGREIEIKWRGSKISIKQNKTCTKQ